MAIHTGSSLRNTGRRLDRKHTRKQQHQLSKELAEMRKGAALHCHFHTHRQLWFLSNGEFVTCEVANELLRDEHVCDVGDAPFVGLPAQSYRYVKA
jgi:hypothetical protein